MDACDRTGIAEVCVGCVLVLAATASAAWATDRASEWNSVDTVTVALACVTVVLTVLAIGVAVLAWFGWNHFKGVAEKVATEIATKKAEEVATKRAEEVAEPIAARVAETVAREGRPTPGDYGAAAATEEGGLDASR